MAGLIPVDENGNPIASPGSAGAPAAVSPPIASPGPRALIPVDENGQPLADAAPSQAPDWFHRNVTPLLNATPYLALGQPGDTSAFGRFKNAIGWREPTDQEKVQGASGIRAVVAPFDFAASVVQGGGIDRANADQVFAETGGNYSGDAVKAVIPVDKSPWLPSQALVSATGMTPNPNETPGLKTEESVLPWLVPTPGTASRVGEATGAGGKVLAGAGSTIMGGVDWALSNEAQDWARQHGYGPEAQTIASILAPLTRGAAFRTTGEGAHVLLGTGEEGGKAYDANRAIGVTPPVSSVGGPVVSAIENYFGSLPLLRGPIVRARNAQKEAIANAAAPGAGADSLLNSIDAEKTVVEPSQPSLLAQILTAHAPVAGLFGGPHNAAAVAGALKLAPYALEDPSVVRALAGRGLTSPLIQQYISRGSLGAAGSPPASTPSALTKSILGYAQ